MPVKKFHLNKWFLEFLGNNGEACIFYAANLTWQGLNVPYTSWLWYDPKRGVSQKSRFRNIRLPEYSKEYIAWGDPKFDVEGTWESINKPIQAQLFNSDEGNLQWNCFQPVSKVKLRIKNKVLKGRGYAEQLILTIPPWHIQMNELRWGCFEAGKINLVWIEIKEEVKKQWVWLNGLQIEKCTIEDDHISIPKKQLVLKLDRGVVLESEKKIATVVESLLRYIPAFKKFIPLNFLMADQYKWLSKAELQIEGSVVSKGIAIHELVNFKPRYP